jgi:transcriptional regulator with XRE-family HTH domain
MTWSPGPVMTRRRLGGELKRLRDLSGLKLEDVAKRLECSPSKISRLENGKGIPRTRDVRDMLDAYGIPEGEQRKRLLEWSRTGQAPMWWREYADVLPSGVDTYVELEWDASRICAYESHLVHGLLQTPEYAAAILDRFWGQGRPGADVSRMVEVRIRRQEALRADHGLMFRCVLDESTLYRSAGSAAVLRGQLEHLVDVASAEHVDVRVLPFTAGLATIDVSSFAKIEFSAGLESGLVYVESTNAFITDPAEIATYERRMADIVNASLTEDMSVPLIERAIRRLEGTASG